MDSVEVEESKAPSSNIRNYFDRGGGPFSKMPFQDILKVTLAPDAKEGKAAQYLSRPINWEHVDRLATSIRTNGYMQNQWPVMFFEPGGHLTVSKGNHRVAALQKLAREGFDKIPFILFTIEHKDKTAEDIAAELLLDNDSLKVDEDTRARVVYELWKFKNQKIELVAEALAMSTTQVSNLLIYNRAPDNLKALVRNGITAPSNIIESMKASGGDTIKASELINHALEMSVAENKSKISARHVKKAKTPTRTKVVQTDVEDFIQNGASEDAQEFVSDLAELAHRAMKVLKLAFELNPEADEVAYELERLLERGSRKGFINTNRGTK